MKSDLFIERYSLLLDHCQFLIKEALAEPANPYQEVFAFFRWLLSKLGQIGVWLMGVLVGIWLGGIGHNLEYPTDLLRTDDPVQIIYAIFYALAGFSIAFFLYRFCGIRYQHLICRPKWVKSQTRQAMAWLIIAFGIYILISLLIAFFYPAHTLSFWASFVGSFELVFNILLLIVLPLLPIVFLIILAFPGHGLWAAQFIGNWKSNNLLPKKVSSALVLYLQEKFPCDEMELCISITAARLERHRYRQVGVEISATAVGVLIAVASFLLNQNNSDNGSINNIPIIIALVLIWLLQLIKQKSLSGEEYQVYDCVQEACLMTKQISDRKEKQKAVERNLLEDSESQLITT
jgi:hypothetical protein